ncbi:MAG: dihydrolipoyl dehydrogenase [Bacillota bacterium]
MYHVVIIGSGPGGYVAALKAAQLGAKVAVVESARLGGTCLNRGCIPTKALVKSATAYVEAQHLANFGVRTGPVELDLPGVMAHKERTVAQLVGGVEKLLSAAGVSLFRGRGQIVAPGRVRVTGADGEQELETKNIIIATGSKPQLPPVDQESLEHTISSDDALALPRVPESMIVIGGGVLGVEFACIWNAFGTRVEMVKRSPLILPPVDEEISRRLMTLLRRKQVKVNSGIYIKEIVDTGGGKRLSGDTKDGGKVSFEAELVLVAMGRVPDFGGLDLDALGIAHDKNGIKTDGHMQTNVPGIYAIGDVVGRTYLAPVASAEGIVAVEHLMGHAREMDYSVIPNCVFSIPEVAGVGLKESEAREKGYDVKVSKFPFSANGRAVAMGETEGLVKLVADDATGRILGMHIMGPHADDLIHEGAMALAMGATGRQVADMIHAHPTLCETIMEAAHGLVGQPLHLARMGR